MTRPTPEASGQFEGDGFFLTPPILPAQLLERVNAHIDATTDASDRLQKLDNRHVDDDLYRAAMSHPAIGEWAAAVTGARMVQIFASQLLLKPTGTEPTANVGWHQDLQYWDRYLEGELFTAWVALSDVTAQSGPMRFIRGSHRWGLLNAGNFFSGDLEGLRRGLEAEHGAAAWDEVPAVLPPGGVSFHHNLTIHGSGPNLAPWPRRSFAIHLRTERSKLRDGVDYGAAGWLNDFADEKACPVIYRG